MDEVIYPHNRKVKYRVLGTFSKDHLFYQPTEENFNSDVFEKFLLSLLEQFGDKKDELKERIISAFEGGLAKAPIYEYLLS